MNNILKIRHPNDYIRYLGQSEQHPLVSIIDYASVSPVRHSLKTTVYTSFYFTMRLKWICLTAAASTTIRKVR